VVRTGFQHNDMRDTGPEAAKASIQGMLDKFIDDDSPLRPVETKAIPELTDPGPVTPFVPDASTPEANKRTSSMLSATMAAPR